MPLYFVIIFSKFIATSFCNYIFETHHRYYNLSFIIYNILKDKSRGVLEMFLHLLQILLWLPHVLS